MANHVYFDCHIECQDDLASKKIKDIFEVAKSQRPYNDMMIDEWDATALPIYETPCEDDNWYTWGIDNMGAKWVSIDDVSLDYFSGHSAWSPIIPLVENLMETVYKLSDDSEVNMTLFYEDEFRNFIGKCYFYIDNGEVRLDEWEFEGDELTELMLEAFGKDKSWLEEDEFDWWEAFPIKMKHHNLKGEKWSPQEYVDEMVIQFREEGKLEHL